MNSYKTIKDNSEATHIVERSKFISHARRVESREQAEEFIAEIKKKYWDARHNVYAYALKNGETRCSDDGEPSGTSGMPTLDVILKQGFSDVCIVTTRYFGGILLGTGGLVRAYSKAAALALEESGSAEITECAVCSLTSSYSLLEPLKRFFSENECVIESIDYAENVHFKYYFRAENLDLIELKITDKFNGELKQTLIKKEFKEL